MADWAPLDSAPRNGTWLELRHEAFPDRVITARSSGRGDAPGIWRFDTGGCLRFSDENRLWRWRPK